MRKTLLASVCAFAAHACIATDQPSAPSAKSSIDIKALESRQNINQTPVGAGKYTLEQLLALTQDEQLALWRTLPAPTFAEMNGHYMGIVPRANDIPGQKNTAARMFDEKYRLGSWQGKAFRPLKANEGEGYNRWRFPGGRIERNLRMQTRIANSIIDGKPCFVLDYPVFNKTTLYDELRKLDEGVYLGAASLAQQGGPNANGTRGKLDMFILIGPTDEWVGPPYTVGGTPLRDGTSLPTKN